MCQAQCPINIKISKLLIIIHCIWQSACFFLKLLNEKKHSLSQFTSKALKLKSCQVQRETPRSHAHGSWYNWEQGDS